MFFALQLDRGNIVQALSDKMLKVRAQHFTSITTKVMLTALRTLALRPTTTTLDRQYTTAVSY